jgi:integrase
MQIVQPIRDKDQLEQMQEILKAKNLRNYIYFMVGIYTGLRVGDIMKLTVGDFRDQEHLHIREQKTGKIKRLKINPRLRKAVNEYIKDRPDHEYLIKSRQGANRPLTRVRAYQILKEVGTQIGFKEIGTHTLRKTFGYHFYRSGPLKQQSVAFLMQWYNHSSEKITLRYIGVLQDEFDEAITKFKF